MNIMFFDLETTGLSKTADFIIELAAVVIDEDYKIIDTFSTFIYPDKIIPFPITQLTGITMDMVRRAPTEQMALLDFKNFIKKHNCKFVAGHNITTFDVPFITTRAERYRIDLDMPKEIIDTLKLARESYKMGMLPNYNNLTKKGQVSFTLSGLINYYNLGSQNHRAVDDVKNNIIIFKNLKSAEEKVDYGF